MSRHPNRVHMETCFSEPKICSNCNLQYAGEIWIYKCLCGCDKTAKVCKPCVAEHYRPFSLRRKTEMCFHCKLVKCGSSNKCKLERCLFYN